MMSPKTREMLDRIDDFLASHSLEAAELWDVLTALRGPDREGLDDKMCTTVPIRVVAFPKTAAMPDEFNGGVKSRAIFEGSPRDFVWPDINSTEHFDHHIRQAAYALGMPR